MRPTPWQSWGPSALLSPAALCDVRRPAQGGVLVQERERLGLGVRKSGGAGGTRWCVVVTKGDFGVQAGLGLAFRRDLVWRAEVAGGHLAWAKALERC